MTIDLKAAREARHLTQNQLAELAGTSQSQIMRLEKGLRKMTVAWAERLSPHLGIAPEAMLFGSHQDDGAQLPVSGLRVEGIVQAGNFRDVTLDSDDEHERATISVARDPRFNGAHQYALLIQGDSMDREFASGTFVTCVAFDDSGLALSSGMIVHVQRTKAAILVETTIKRYVLRDGKRMLCPESTNPAHLPVILEGDEDADTEIEVKGVVTGSWKPQSF